MESHRTILSLAINLLLSIACSVWEQPGPTVETADGKDGLASTALDLTVAGVLPASKAESWWLIKRVDAFVFDDDGVKHLDSYNRSVSYSTDKTSILSGNGDKTVFVVANAAFTDSQIEGINRYDDLESLTVSLSDDDPHCPVMSGEAVFEAGKDKVCHVQLSPIMSLIEVNSLICDFKGEYSGKHLSDVKVYLTGISNRCEVARSDGFLPSEILNAEGLSEDDMGRLKYSGIAYRYLGNGRMEKDGSWQYGYASLYCYPNECKEESIGSPFTRLVVEGSMDGEVWRYPIDINREGFGFKSGTQGISRNVRYSLDIVISKVPG